MIRYSLAVLLLSALSCTTVKKSQHTMSSALDLQGHRGARGLMPENTIPAMLKAIDLDVTTLEMDVVISKDNKVVVSHDPYFSHSITTTPQGKHLTQKEATNYLLYQMPYDSIKKYDVGLKTHPDFPRQQKMAVHKPLLSDLIDAAEQYAAQKGKKMLYNIEIKSKQGFDGTRHPEPARFADLLVDVLKEKNILGRTTIQSFDVRALKYVHQQYPNIVLSYLVEVTAEPLQAQLDKLGFVPPIYSPHYSMVSKELVAQSHHQNMKIIPWTINNIEGINALVDMGVDGIISDYPDLFAEIKKKK